LMGYPKGEIPMLDVHGQTVQGATYAVPIWHEYMAAALYHHKVLGFELPDKYPTWRPLTRGNYGSLGSYYTQTSTSTTTTTSTPTTTASVAPAKPAPTTVAPKPPAHTTTAAQPPPVPPPTTAPAPTTTESPPPTTTASPPPSPGQAP